MVLIHSLFSKSRQGAKRYSENWDMCSESQFQCFGAGLDLVVFAQQINRTLNVVKGKREDDHRPCTRVKRLMPLRTHVNEICDIRRREHVSNEIYSINNLAAAENDLR